MLPPHLPSSRPSRSVVTKVVRAVKPTTNPKSKSVARTREGRASLTKGLRILARAPALLVVDSKRVGARSKPGAC
jgi:hypothetical protein